jgi:hypothetical protein
VTVSVAGQDLVKPLFDFHGSSIDIGSHSAVVERLQQQLVGYGELVFKPRQSSFFRFDPSAVRAGHSPDLPQPVCVTGGQPPATGSQPTGPVVLAMLFQDLNG